MFSLWLALVANFAIPSSAEASDLLSHLVYSKTSIQSQSSDYQGKTGALGSISLSRFEIAGDLNSASSVSLTDGSVRGQVRAPKVELVRAGAARRKFTGDVAGSLQTASYELDALSMRLQSYPASGVPTQTGAVLKLTANFPSSVIDIDAATLEQAGEIYLEGSGYLLVRVHGDRVAFRGKRIQLAPSLPASWVVFFFPDALSLDISRNGGASSPEGVHLGIPGAVVAPRAVVQFSEVLVTGPLYVGQLCSNAGENGGQVNFGRSEFLEQVAGGCRSTCGR